MARRVHVAEIAKNAQAPDSQVRVPTPRYDIMQANAYMMSGLAESALDKWFSGQAPKFSLEELGGVEEGTGDLAEAMERARKVANDPKGIEWPHVRSSPLRYEITELIWTTSCIPGRQEVKRRDLSGLDRNLELLTQEIALRGSRLFSRTTSAACASASGSGEEGSSHFTAANDVRLGVGERIVIRERTARDGKEVRIYSAGLPRFELGLIEVEQGPGVRQYLAMWIAGTTVKSGMWHDVYDWKGFFLLKHIAVLLIVRISYKMEVGGGGRPGGIAFALGECRQGGQSIDIMDADFFDETLLVIAFRSEEDGMSLR
jgi:hypothetical protein